MFAESSVIWSSTVKLKKTDASLVFLHMYSDYQKKDNYVHTKWISLYILRKYHLANLSIPKHGME